MATKKQSAYSIKYAKSHVVRIPLDLNRTTDADILHHLDQQANRNGYIKALIRQDIEQSKAPQKAE